MFSFPDKISAFTSLKPFTALLAVFLIHNAEEAFTICNYPTVSYFEGIQTLSCRQFLVSVSVISTVAILLYLLAVFSKSPKKYVFISSGLAAALLLNTIIPHLLVALLTWQYTPGLFAALLLVCPISVLVVARNRQQYSNRSRFFNQILLFIIPAYLFFALVTRLTMLFA